MAPAAALRGFAKRGSPSSSSKSGQIVDASKAIRGRDSFARVPAGIVYPVLRLPLAPKLTGLPHSAVPYFFLEQTYDTTRARELLEPHGIRCPGFAEYVGALVNFVD